MQKWVYKLIYTLRKQVEGVLKEPNKYTHYIYSNLLYYRL